MTRVAIIAAVPGELGPLVQGWAREPRGAVELWRRREGDNEWVAACAGMGVYAAALAFAEVEKDGAVNAAVSTGWAGALGAEFAGGHAYRVTAVVDARSGERFTCAPGPGSCLLVTGIGVAGPAEKRRLATAFGADLVDMEAAGIARMAAARRIPFHCVKGVSDGPADRLPDLNAFINPAGQFEVARFARHAAVRPWQWPTLLRLGSHSRKSARAIGSMLPAILNGR